ncbi:MAG: tetratricopeptide repeat protein [Acidobacteriia bacterium]|nr:tetratricopeptide repeat protein [Terriglobia bacterium]
MKQRTIALAITLMLGLGGSAWAESAPVSAAVSGGAAVAVGINEMLSAGRVDDAVKALDVRLKDSPRDAEAYNLLSRSYFAMQKWDRAVAAGEKAVSIAPNNSEYHMWLGRAYAEKADHSSFVTAATLTKKIRQEFERAVELDASNVSARSDLAEFYIEAPAFMGGGKSKARQQAEALAQQDEAAAHWLQARIAEKDKRFDVAEQEYHKAIQASGNQGSYWLNLASFYRRQKRLSEMEAAITSAMAADKKRPNVLFDAAQILFGAGRNFVGAANFVRKYLVNGPTVEEAPAFQAHYLLGEILEKEGDKAGAATEYKAALALASDYERARTALNRLNQK